MSHVTELPADWQEKLEQYVIDYRYSVIVDPDGENIELPVSCALVSFDGAQEKHELDPAVAQVAETGEVTIELYDPEGYLRADSPGSLFHRFRSSLYESVSASATALKVARREGQVLAAGDVLVIDDENAETVTVASVDGSAEYYDTVVLESAIASDHQEDAVVRTRSWAGKKVRIDLWSSDVSDPIALYTGVILSEPEYVTGRCRLRLGDPIRAMLAQPVTGADTTEVVGADGLLVSSVSCPSTVSLDSDRIELKSGCHIGSWTLRFASATAYQLVSAPAGVGVSDELYGIDAWQKYAHVSGAGAPNYLDGASFVRVNSAVAGYLVAIGRGYNSRRIVSFSASSGVLTALSASAQVEDPRHLICSGNYAWVVGTQSDMAYVWRCDITNPNALGSLTTYSLGIDEAYSAVEHGGDIIIATGDDAFNSNSIRNISVSINILLPGAKDALGEMVSLNSRVYLAAASGKIWCINTGASSYTYDSGAGAPKYLSGAYGVAAYGNYVLVACETYGALAVYDATGGGLSWVTTFKDSAIAGAKHVTVVGTKAFVSCQSQDKVVVLNISDVEDISVVTTVEGAANYVDGASGSCYDGTYVYVTAGDSDAIVTLAEIAAHEELDNEDIRIPSNAWTGCPEAGDEVTFKTAISYENENAITVIEDVLERAGVGSIDAETFQAAQHLCEIARYNVSLSLERAMNWAQAIELVCRHFGGYVYFAPDGTAKVRMLAPHNPAGLLTSGSDTVLRWPEAESVEPVNAVTVNYAYDYDANEYQYSVVATDDVSIQTRGRLDATVNLPGFYEADVAQAFAERMVYQYRDGLKKWKLKADMKECAAELGELRKLEVVELEIDDVVNIAELRKSGPVNEIGAYSAAHWGDFVLADVTELGEKKGAW